MSIRAVEGVQLIASDSDYCFVGLIALSKPRQDRARFSQVSLLVHEINNLVCSIRLYATNLQLEPQFCELSKDILSATRQVESRVADLAALAADSVRFGGTRRPP